MIDEPTETEAIELNSSTTSHSTRRNGETQPSTMRGIEGSMLDEEPGFLRRWSQWLDEYKGMGLVLASEIFAAFMAAATRLLALGEPGTEREGMTTLQILFARFSITALISSGYMWYDKVPHFPFGMKEVRGILVLRGFFGFSGIFAFYYSLRYLPLAEAITLSFMIPLSAACAYHLVLHEPFHRNQLFAGLVALFGIVLIARPFSFITGSEEVNMTNGSDSGRKVSTFHRISAIFLGLLSVVFVAGALTSIRLIGDRAHTLISVNYYALVTTIFSAAILLLPIIPGVDFRMPRTLREWLLLLALGVAGFMTQTLMTMGLVRDKTNRATNVMYSEVIFALGLDYLIWGVVPDVIGWVGMGFVVGGTLWGVLQKGKVQNIQAGETGGEYEMVGDDDDLEGQHVTGEVEDLVEGMKERDENEHA